MIFCTKGRFHIYILFLVRENPLKQEYCFWYWKRGPGSKDYGAHCNLVCTFETVEEFWAAYSHLTRPGIEYFLYYELILIFLLDIYNYWLFSRFLWVLSSYCLNVNDAYYPFTFALCWMFIGHMYLKNIRLQTSNILYMFRIYESWHFATFSTY